MDSKKPKQSKTQKSKKGGKAKALSVIGALTLGATLPASASAANVTVAERIARIRDAFAKSAPAGRTAAAGVIRASLAKPGQEQADFADFADFSNFSDFKQVFADFHNTFANFGNAWLP